ncbi:MAG: nuclease-related domain-containing protein [Proteobacteria bacterium]|nr:nuclease-related domain-containing protein [Pseudomonadota bacterium]
MDKKVSPLKAKPLRQPGQSIEEQMDNLLNGEVMPYILLPVMAIAFAAFEWYRHVFDPRLHPILFSILAIISVLVCIPKIIKLKKKLKNLVLGRDGEKAVGQFLELLREDGCMVFHDIVGDNFNIDHVVVSEKGVYCIETKTYSKPSIQKPTVKYKDGKLTIDGLGDKSKILDQVKAASSWLKSIIKDSTGKRFEVKPVILFPGWWTESDKKDIWVLEPKGFPKFLNNQKEQLPTDIKKMIGLHLSRYIRSL